MLNVKILEHTPNPEQIVATAAKLCYSSSDVTSLFEKQTPQLIESFLKKLIDMGHMSPVEHVAFTFAIEGISRITEIQLVRHRLASYSIQSGRYVNRNNPEFVIPPAIKASKVALERYNKVMEESMNAYNDLFLILMLTQLGFSDKDIEYLDTDKRIEIVAKLQETDKKLYGKYEKNAVEDARYAHLQSLATRLIMTMNVRELFHFFRHRCCTRAQWEIRTMAEEMLRQLKVIAPTLFKNAGPACLTSVCPEGNMTCGKMAEMREKYKSI
jgi:thymidylate synthase (FAD)